MNTEIDTTINMSNNEVISYAICKVIANLSLEGVVMNGMIPWFVIR